MHFTIPEQTIVKCIYKASEPVTYTYLVRHTRMRFTDVDKALKEMLLKGRVEIGLQGGFVLTKKSKNNPIVRLLLQELCEERLLVKEQRRFYQHKKLTGFFSSNKCKVYGWARRIQGITFGRRPVAMHRQQA